MFFEIDDFCLLYEFFVCCNCVVFEVLFEWGFDVVVEEFECYFIVLECSVLGVFVCMGYV